MSRVELTVGLPNFGVWAQDWPRLLDVARAADEAGVARVVVTDHVVMGRNTEAYVWGRFPTAPDAPWLEPLTCLTAIAAVTQRVRLGTGILIAPLRPAPVLAKTVATLDVVSDGRVDLGVGVGWQREEYDAVGLDFDARGRLLDETIAACRQLWSQLPGSYAGESTAFADVFCAPQPVQERLPVWFAGTLNARNVRRISELGDGWIPIMGASVDDIRAGAARLRAACDRRLDIQAPLPLVRHDDRSIDVQATMEHVPDLVAAGVTNIYVNVAALAGSPAGAEEALTGFAQVFEEARG